MYFEKNHIIKICPTLMEGIDKLAACAQKSYGNGKATAFFDCHSNFHAEMSFRTVMQKIESKDIAVQTACKFLVSLDCPEDGVKTAVILLNALLRETAACGISERQLSESLTPVVSYMKEYLTRIDQETGKGIPGGGLYLLNLARPLDYFAARYSNHEAVVQAVISILAEPLKLLAENAGIDPCQVYERVKMLAPNQFFSLHHFGLERSIDRETGHVDIFSIGLDVSDSKIKNLMDADIMVSLDTGCKILDYLDCATKKLFAIASVQI